MTQATHTPGPWRITETGPAKRYVIDGFVDSIAMTYGQDRQEGDARLIAAAPELLAALEQCLPIIDAHRRLALGEGDVAAMNARAAIAKAKGE